MPHALGSGSRRISSENIAFCLLLLATCAWILSLPLFPSQDGSAHKFYASVLGRLVAGDQSVAHSYLVRHPFPPYASQAVFLVALSRVVDIDLADKLFVCLVVLCTAFGFRWCCISVGPGGRWTSLFVFPLLLNWSLLMGFMNYALGVGLLFLVFACWIRATEGQSSYWIGFVAFTALITLTHPIPLLMLLVLCCFDAATQAFSRSRRSLRLPARAAMAQTCSILLLLAALAFPLLNADPARTTSDMTHSMFRWRAYLTDLTLYGLSPYARHSHVPLVLLYKLMLYVVLLAAFLASAHGFRLRWLDRTTGRADFFLAAAVLLYLGLPLIPGEINGSQFATRMLPFAWFGVLLAASRLDIRPPQKKLLLFASAAVWALTILPAQQYIRPSALQLDALQKTPFPARQHGLILTGRDGPGAHTQLEFGPQIWGSMLPMMRNEDVLVNSPWLDLTSYPVGPGEDPYLMINELPLRQDKQEIDKHDGDLSYLPVPTQQRVLAGTDFIFVTGSGSAETGLIPALSPAQTRQFRCTSHQWFLLCPRVKSPD